MENSNLFFVKGLKWIIIFVFFLQIYSASTVLALDVATTSNINATTTLNVFGLSSTTTTNQISSVSTEMIFTRHLMIGDVGNDVSALQQFLKKFPDIYPEGRVTGYFGPLTESAVKNYQKLRDIESIGEVGPMTRKLITEEILNSPSDLDRHLQVGDIGGDVVTLQKFLKKFPEIYPEGVVTGYFGFLTESAVKKYQDLHNIESIGEVGPLTRQLITAEILLLKQSSQNQSVTSLISTTTATSTPLNLNVNLISSTTTTTATSTTSFIATSTTTTTTTTTTTSGGSGSGGGGTSTSPASPAPAVATVPVTKTCPMTLASGNQRYFVQTSNQPQIMEVAIDPLDALIGSIQNITVKIRDTNNNDITKVEVVITGDSGVQANFILPLTSGLITNGTWSGSWTIVGSQCDNFMVSVSATSASGVSLTEISLK